VDEVAAEHHDHLLAQIEEDPAGRRRVEGDIDQPRRRPAVVADHQLHQQHALVEHHRPRHAHARGEEPRQRRLLGALPGVLGRVPPEAAAAVDRALRARVAGLAALLVLDVVLEAARRAVLVDLRRDDDAVAPDQRDVGFLAALQPAENLVDDAIGDQDVELVGHWPSR